MKRFKFARSFRFGISGRIIKMQHQLADYLNTQTRDFSRNAWLFLLCLFCLAFGSSCLYLIIHAIF